MPKSKKNLLGWFAVAAVLLSTLTSNLLVPNVKADNQITMPKKGYVTVEFVSSEAVFIDDVYLLGKYGKMLLFDTSKTRLGTVAPMAGSGGKWGVEFEAGTVLEFELFARAADPSVTYTWSSDPSKNGGEDHVKTTPLGANTWKMEWEDKPLSEDQDFDDAVMVVRVDGDSDGDGLWDSWETNGVDIGYDDTIDLPIHQAPYNADPNHKDIFLEIDWMESKDHSHKPKKAAIDMVKAAFANASKDSGGIDNPDGKKGITLHVDVSNAVPHQDYLRMFTESEKLSPPAGVGDFDTVKAANFDPDRRSVYHYCLFAHDLKLPNNPTGHAEYHGNDLIVSLGEWTDKVGTVMEQAGTLMHELGHNLGLQEGGIWDEITHKPNYLSVMNYFFQFSGIPPTNRIDYSHEDLPDLDENGLNETLGIQGTGIHKTDDTFFYDPYFTRRKAHGTDPIDWNWNKIEEENVKADINGDGKYSKLWGCDDWENLRLLFADCGDFEDGVHKTLSPEMDKEIAKKLDEFYTPDLHVTKSADLVSAIPSDTLTYTVTVENVGKGPAAKIELVDTFPDGTTDTRPMADLDAGDSTTETFSFVVPFPILDLTVLTNTVTVTGENVRGEPEEDTSNNMATVSTVVHTPVFALSKSVTSFVNAGEAITYTITFENTGSGDAEGVEITDTLPSDVYYSLALDQGSGPQPDLVTGNIDGTTTLTWLVGSVPSGSGTVTIEYTARPSLLLFAGESVSNDASLDFTDANANDYSALSASASTDVTSLPPGQQPRSLGFMRNHEELWSDEILARIQATDDRFDGADGTLPDGQLSAPEVQSVLAPGGNQPKVLVMQLLITYYNLATRQINADTVIDSPMASQLALGHVREAVEYAMNTLKLPVNKFTRAQYSHITLVLDEINNNLSEIY